MTFTCRVNMKNMIFGSGMSYQNRICLTVGNGPFGSSPIERNYGVMKEKEKYIDVNVFHGSKEEFLSFPRFCSDACEGSNP